MDLFFQLHRGHSGTRCYFLHLLLVLGLKSLQMLQYKARNYRVLLKILAVSQRFSLKFSTESTSKICNKKNQ